LTDEDEEAEAKIIECYVKIKDLHIEEYGECDKRTLKNLRELALVQSKKKLYEDALNTIVEIESSEKVIYGEKSKQLAKTYSLKATLLYKIGDRAQAKELLRKAAQLYEDLGDKDSASKTRVKLEQINQSKNYD
jgi:tetratricopeptide (TPR) repeat protein